PRKARHLLAAGRAPGSPEVHQHGLAAQRGEIDLAPSPRRQPVAEGGLAVQLVGFHRAAGAVADGAEMLDAFGDAHGEHGHDGEGDERLLEPARHHPGALLVERNPRVRLAHDGDSLSFSTAASTRCLNARFPSISTTGMSCLCSSYNSPDQPMSISRNSKASSRRKARMAAFAVRHKEHRSRELEVAVPCETVSFIMSRSVPAVSGLSRRMDPVGSTASPSMESISDGSMATPPLPTAAAISAACIGDSFTSPNPAALFAKSSPVSGICARDCSSGWSKMGRWKRNCSAALRR